eukprot:SAG31_NODE_10592_length_1120_cov_1.236043_2_plen_70_part_00
MLSIDVGDSLGGIYSIFGASDHPELGGTAMTIPPAHHEQAVRLCLRASVNAPATLVFNFNFHVLALDVS